MPQGKKRPRPAPRVVPEYVDDRELRKLLGGISGTELWRLRKLGKLPPPRKFHDSPKARNYNHVGENMQAASENLRPLS